MMELIENCLRSTDSSGLHSLQNMWDDSNPNDFSCSRLLRSDKTLLMTAAKMGHLNCSRYLLSVISSEVNTRNGDGFTALHYAAYHGHEEVAFLLLNAGADPRLCNNYQENALDSALAGGHVKFAERLRLSRFYTLTPFGDLFDFSGDFMSDLNKRLESFDGRKDDKNNSSSTYVRADSSTYVRADSSSGSSNSNDNILSISKNISEIDNHLSDGEIDENINENNDKYLKNEQKNIHDGKIGSEIKKFRGKNNLVYGMKIEQKTVNNEMDLSGVNVVNVSGLSRKDAGKYYLEVKSAIDGGSESIIGQICDCLEGDKDISHIDKVKSHGEDCMMIGRSRLNQFCLDDLSVSKQHATISYVTNIGYFLKDLGSKHGTFVDGSRVSTSSTNLNEKNVKMEMKKCGKNVENVSSGNTTLDNELLITDGMEIRFGRIVCHLKRRRQSAIITSGFQPNLRPSQVEDTAEVLGKKRDAVMALYGHYNNDKREKIQKKSFEIQNIDVQRPKEIEGNVPLTDQRPGQIEGNDQGVPIGNDIGAALMQKMGWNGSKIGKNGGILKPIVAVKRVDGVGLGFDNAIIGEASECGNMENMSRKEIERKKMICRYQDAI